MAAPASKNIRDLNGTWIMVSTYLPHRSDSINEPHILSPTDQAKLMPKPQNKTLSDSPDAGLALQGIGWLTRKGIGLATVTLHVKQYDEAGVTHIDIEQSATGGVKGTTENRALDNEWREHSDWLFGKVKGRSEWLAAPVADEPYLNGNWEAGTSEWVHNVAESLDNGWIATQTWGFQVVNGERRHTRNVVIKKVRDALSQDVVFW